MTFVVSPLLTLMNNQMEAAQNVGLSCDCLNSKTTDRRLDILNNIINNELDIVFITPETLFSKDVQEALSDINIGLFVIDEAHCISDLGHDFRLDYCNIYKVLNTIPKNIPVLGTTATANNRVVEDLKRQLGNDVFVSRGSIAASKKSVHTGVEAAHVC